MTREEILSMPAGPEMDRLVAPLAGWREMAEDERSDRRHSASGKGWWTNGTTERYSDGSPPAFSSRVEDAFEVLERLPLNGWVGFAVRKNVEGYYVAGYVQSEPYGGERMPVEHSADSFTAAHAICKAALLLAVPAPDRAEETIADIAKYINAVYGTQAR